MSETEEMLNIHSERTKAHEVHIMLRVRVCVAQMGGFSPQNVIKTGPLSADFPYKHEWV